MVANIEWFGMAEGATEDARQALTLVAVNQNAIVTPTLPSLQKRFFVLMLSNVSDAGAPGANIGVVFAITGPDDKVLLVQHATAALPEPASSAIPETGGQMIFQAGLGIEEYGAYVARCTLTLPNGAKLEAERRFWVVESLEPALPPQVRPSAARASQARKSPVGSAKRTAATPRPRK